MGFDDYSDWRPEPMPEPWLIVPNALRHDLLGELQRELSEGHPLFGEESVAAVAKCGGCDDVVFSIDGGRFIRWAPGSSDLEWAARDPAAAADTRVPDLPLKHDGPRSLTSAINGVPVVGARDRHEESAKYRSRPA